MLKLTSSDLEDIEEGQKSYLGLIDWLVPMNQGKELDFRIDESGVMRFRDRACLPDFPNLKKKILEDGYKSGSSIHLGATKMYKDLKKMFWWPGMKKEVTRITTCH